MVIPKTPLVVDEKLQEAFFYQARNYIINSVKEDIYLGEKRIKRKKRMAKLKIYGALAFFLVTAAAGFYLIVYSSFFRINNIAVFPADNLDSEKIVGDLKIFFESRSKLASFLGSDNILMWEDKIPENFFKNHPKIVGLKINKNYLSGKIEITVKKRERFGVWCQIQTDDRRQTTDDCFWFDKDGVIFEEAAEIEGELIGKVNDYSGRELRLGDSVMVKNLFKNLRLVFKFLEDSSLNAKTLRLDDLSAQEIIAESPVLPKIFFSLRISPYFGLNTVGSLRKTGLKKIEYIDLRVENRVYYKIK